MDDETRIKYGVLTMADEKALKQAAKIADSPTYWARFEKKSKAENAAFVLEL